MLVILYYANVICWDISRINELPFSFHSNLMLMHIESTHFEVPRYVNWELHQQQHEKWKTLLLVSYFLWFIFKTLLHLASNNGHSSCVKALIDVGADVNAQNVRDLEVVLWVSKRCEMEISDSIHLFGLMIFVWLSGWTFNSTKYVDDFFIFFFHFKE